MNWWKPQDTNQTTKIRFNATPNTYSSTHWVKGTGKSGCPICDELESEKTRRGNLFAFIKNIGAEDSAVGKAILKAFDEKIAMLEPKVIKTATVMRMPIPDSWSSMDITQKMQWCITNLDADALLTQMIKKEFDKLPTQNSTITGGKSNVINVAKKDDGVIGNPIDLYMGMTSNDIRESSKIEQSADRIISIKKDGKDQRKAQLTTKFNLTVDYIKQNVMPILHKYGMHEVDAFSAVFARFRSDPDYAVVLTVKDFSVFEMTPDIAINLIVHLYDEGHLTKK